MCINWDLDDPLLIHGHEYDENHQRLEAILTPCNYKHNKINVLYDDKKPTKCIDD